MEIKYEDDWHTESGDLTPEQLKAIMNFNTIMPDGSSIFRASYTPPWWRRLLWRVRNWWGNRD